MSTRSEAKGSVSPSRSYKLISSTGDKRTVGPLKQSYTELEV